MPKPSRSNTRAIELNSDLADAYYRLGQAYVRTGQKDRAQEQFQVYQRLREQRLADLDKQRAENSAICLFGEGFPRGETVIHFGLARRGREKKKSQRV